MLTHYYNGVTILNLKVKMTEHKKTAKRKIKDKKEGKNLAYLNTTRLQQGLTKMLSISDSKLMSSVNSACVIIQANKLADKYFSKTKDPEIKTYIIEMLKYWIVLASITNNLKQVLRVEQNELYFLSWIKRCVNDKVRRYYIRETIMDRRIEPEKIRDKIVRCCGVEDGVYVEQLLTLFVEQYTRTSATGRLAQRMFDPLYFYEENMPLGCKIIKNRKIELQKITEKSPEANDIRAEKVLVLDKYTISYQENEKGKFLAVEIAPQEIDEFKNCVKQIIKEDNQQNVKKHLLNALISRKTDDWKYAFYSMTQIFELGVWMQRYSPLKHNKELNSSNFGEKLTVEFHKKIKKIFIPEKHNMFWKATDYEEVEWVNTFNPYL